MNGTMGLRSSMQTSIEAEGKMGLYFRTAPMLVTMKSIPLLDAELDMGAEADAKRTGRPNGQICSDVNINFPVFKLGAGNESVKYKNKKSLLCTMNISKDCEFASFAKSKSLHYEILADGTKQFVDECTYNEQSEMISQRKVRQVQKHQHRRRRRSKLMKTRQAHFIHIRREWRNIFQSRQHFILTIWIIGLWYQSQLMRIQKGLQFK